MRCGRLPSFFFFCLATCAAIVASAAISLAQTTSSTTSYSHQYSYGFFTEYSPTSSHIVLGVSRQRELFAVGGDFTWRLVSRRNLDLNYLVEMRPLILESDPTVVSFYSNEFGYIQYSTPIPVIDPRNLAYPYGSVVAEYAADGYSDAKFSRRWTYNGGVSPFGIQLNGFKQRRFQPEAMLNGGLMVATREIPIEGSSYFNFTFQFGGGVEWYRTPSQSLLLEYRIQHFSNKNLGTYNPGTDSGVWKLTYRFGRR